MIPRKQLLSVGVTFLLLAYAIWWRWVGVP